MLQQLFLRTFLLRSVRHAAKLTWMPQQQDTYCISLKKLHGLGYKSMYAPMPLHSYISLFQGLPSHVSQVISPQLPGLSRAVDWHTLPLSQPGQDASLPESVHG